MKRMFLILIWITSFIYADFSRDNGVVSDNTTNLEWQDDYSDNSGNIKEASWIEAITYCKTLTLDGGNWRLPNINELLSLVDDKKYDPAINDIFVYTQYGGYEYWSSTTRNSTTYSGAWTMIIGPGFYGIQSKEYNALIRCVRDNK